MVIDQILLTSYIAPIDPIKVVDPGLLEPTRLISVIRHDSDKDGGKDMQANIVPILIFTGSMI
ncbi:MAG: hypothetical protein KJP07_20590 [Desulfatitalea sp.]|nr:hypothetical protein [Desulfatitalea sp.]